MDKLEDDSTVGCEDTKEQQRKTKKREEMEEVMRRIDVVIDHNRRLVELWTKANDQLMEVLTRVRAQLTECRVHRLNPQPYLKPSEVFHYITVGKPYFKDRKCNPPPDNEDTIIMKKCGMFDFSNAMSVSGWTVGDKGRLMSCLLDMSKAIIRKQIVSEISDLKYTQKTDKETLEKIAELRKEIILLKNKKIDDLDLPLDQEFDWEDVAIQLNRRHTSNEYKAIWNLFFHPKINKSTWSHVEHQQLQKLATERDHKDWDAIAKALNTGRTGYQCFVYFRTNVSHSGTEGKWTKEEMDELQRVINLYMEEHYIPWGKVAAAMKNRTKIQCYNKYTRMIECRKGRFLPEEDAVILNFVNVYGTDFRKMASFLSGRSAMQLRVRYNLLMKTRVSATWSLEDDKKLLQIMANQESRTNFSSATKYFPGKDRQNIRSRYLTLVKWMRTHPFSDLSTAPRRGPRRLIHGEATSNLVNAIANLEKKMELEIGTNQEAEYASGAKPSKHKLSRSSSHYALNDAIMIQVANAQARETRHQETSLYNIQLTEANDSMKHFKLQEIASSPQETANMINLQQCLYILNGVIENKDKFYQSKVGRGFDSMVVKEAESSLIQVKSYSKKGRVESVEMHIKPDLFGTIAGRRRFMFPPNFATITASRVFLTHLTSAFNNMEKDDLNIRMISRKNFIVNDLLIKLRERFIDLFTWPYILSNKCPAAFESHSPDRTRSRAGVNLLPGVPSITIPSLKKKFRQHKNNKNIDAAENNDLKAINVDLKMDNDLSELHQLYKEL